MDNGKVLACGNRIGSILDSVEMGLEDDDPLDGTGGGGGKWDIVIDGCNKGGFRDCLRTRTT